MMIRVVPAFRVVLGDEDLGRIVQNPMYVCTNLTDIVRLSP